MWTSQKSKSALAALAPYARRHRRFLVRGIFASVAVVLFRLALPWPLRGFVEYAFPGHESGNGLNSLLADVPGGAVLWLCSAYVLFAVGAGLSEMIQRTQIKKFSAHSMHDLRAAAVRGVVQQPGEVEIHSADLIARVIGDTARIKAGMNGILVHICQNALLFLGVCGMLFWISPPLALYFIAGGLITIVIGMRTSVPVAETTEKYREKEGEYAIAIQEALEFGDPEFEDSELNDESAEKDVKTTRLIAVSSLLTHFVLSLAVAMALWQGLDDVALGQLAPGGLFLFIAYALTVHRRLIQIGRQLARSGKVFACMRRLEILLPESSPPAEPESARLGDLAVRDVRLRSSRSKGGAARLRSIDLQVPSGSHVAVVGKSGSGKTSLLRVLAGAERPSRGDVCWGGEVPVYRDGVLYPHVSCLPQDPVFVRTTVRQLLRLEAHSLEEVSQRDRNTLTRLGAWQFISRYPKGLEEKVASMELSRGERKTLRLAATVLQDRPLTLLDEPFELQANRAVEPGLAEIVARTRGRTLVVARRKLVAAHLFDRIVQLRKGRIQFDGTPQEWEARKCKA